jgi:hypothetical protein
MRKMRAQPGCALRPFACALALAAAAVGAQASSRSS